MTQCCQDLCGWWGQLNKTLTDRNHLENIQPYKLVHSKWLLVEDALWLIRLCVSPSLLTAMNYHPPRVKNGWRVFHLLLIGQLTFDLYLVRLHKFLMFQMGWQDNKMIWNTSMGLNLLYELNPIHGRFSS